MKHVLLIILLAATCGNALSQDFMAVIAQKGCSCAETLPDTLDATQSNMKLGVCMIEASMPYKKQIKKTYDIDLDNIDKDGEKLGRLIGVKMATVCPDALVKISQRSVQKTLPVKEDLFSAGTVTKIDNEPFVTFSIKDESGKVTKYYWLTFIDTQYDLANSYSAISGKSVRINYESREFFDPRLLEYRQFLVIKKMEVMN